MRIVKGQLIRFLLVRDGRGMYTLKKVVEENGVEGYFHFVPQQLQHEIPAILAGADAASISFADKTLFSMTIPAKLQSYMACGVPILASVSGETKAIIEEAACGLVSETGNAEALVKDIEHMLAMRDSERGEMAINALNYAASNFSKTELMSKFENII